MHEPVLELAAITLSSESTETELLSASQRFQKDFLEGQEGFIRRDMIRKADGSYLDVILWQSQAHADAVFERAQSSPAAGQYFAHMAFDPEHMDAGVEHCLVLHSFTKG